MNHRLVAEEVLYILDHSDALAVLVSDRFLPMVESRSRPGREGAVVDPAWLRAAALGRTPG